MNVHSYATWFLLAYGLMTAAIFLTMSINHRRADRRMLLRGSNLKPGSLTISAMCEAAYANAKLKGFHTLGVTFGDRIALIHSELSEVLEVYRMTGLKGVRDQQVSNGKPEGIPSELADVIIRVGDLCGAYGIDLEAAVKSKMQFNRTRSFRHGNKKL